MTRRKPLPPRPDMDNPIQSYSSWCNAKDAAQNGEQKARIGAWLAAEARCALLCRPRLRLEGSR